MADPPKMSPEAANYRDRDSEGIGWLRHCGDCAMFQAPIVPPYSGSCTLVAGAIWPEKVCDFWTAT